MIDFSSFINKEPETIEQIKESLKFLNQILDYGVKGVGPLSSAVELAESYKNKSSYSSIPKKVNALARIEGTKNFTSGFLTSLGGIITLPVMIPISLGLNLVIQTRMVAAMAHLGGFDIEEPGVKVSIALCLLGKRGKEIINANPSDFGNLFRSGNLSHFPKKSLLILNRIVAIQLMKVATQKGFIRVSKAIPIFGGIVGGVLDFHSCYETSEFAKELFKLSDQTTVQKSD